MRIQHNLAALNSYRQLNGNNNAVSKNLEKLSSGYRINRAGDDAAGLAISEKMRAQIKGLETAQKNANDGISLVQTAEGALTEVHSMLNRMTELATQSANGTYDNEVDRNNLQKEITSLKSEIDRISESTNYNGIKLLDGSLGGTAGAGSTTDGSKVAYIDGPAVTSNAAVKDKFGISGGSVSVAGGTSATVSYKNAAGEEKKVTLTNTTGASQNLEDMIAQNSELNSLFSATAGGITSRVAGSGGATIVGIDNNGTAVQKEAAGTGATDSKIGADASVDLDFSQLASGDTFTIGDKTYELTTTAGDASKGNVEITVGGTTGAAKTAAIIQALKNNGVSSAYASDAANEKIGIGNMDEVSAVSKGNAVSVDTATGSVTATAAKKNIYDTSLNAGQPGGFAVAGSATSSQTLKISLTDENGEAQEISINYTSDANAANNQTNILNALKNDTTFNKYFAVDGTDITSKTAGGNAAKISGITTSDTTMAASGSISLDRTQAAKDSVKKLELTDVGAGSTVTVDGKTYEFVNDGQEAKEGNIAVALGKGTTATADSAKNLANTLRANGVELEYNNGTDIEFSNEGKENVTGAEGGLKLQVGDTNEAFNKVTVKVGNMDTKTLGISGINIGKQDEAGAAIEKIKAAINSVSSTRGDLGAIQNRLEHTINNLGVTTENMTAAESRIRDTDMASEMMTYTKNNILTQAAQAMLAQANQLPQGVLQLLQ